MHEEAAFRGAWEYLTARVKDSTIYYYSKYERTEYKKLPEKYPAVCSVGDVEALFAGPVMIDLYFDVIKRATEWPLYNQSIKTIAKFLDFRWRDNRPSGAASIEWYNRWIETGDFAIKQRILDYNEDDCLATGVVVDAIRALPVKT
jgi:predicted RecB family nuclease